MAVFGKRSMVTVPCKFIQTINHNRFLTILPVILRIKNLAMRYCSNHLRFLLVLATFVACRTQQKETPDLQITQLDPAEAAATNQKIRSSVEAKVAEGLELSLYASDTLLADPIALHIDPQGRAYVSSTDRGTQSEFDIRGHQDWMTESISFQTVEDRRAFLRRIFDPANSEQNKWLSDLNQDSIHDWQDLKVEPETIYRIEDHSGDGVADFSQVFYQGFTEEITDVMNGVLAHEGDVFASVAPDVWRLRDTNGDGMADQKESISHGWGVHIGFGGHGMSGLTVGPDGKIWWGIGDIGMNVTDKAGKQWNYANEGVIVRCNPDGSDFEVFCSGLRNTHEFVFDDYGNLITEDNDGDHPGESERLVYLVDGSDSGWRINWQFGKYTDPDNNSYKVWMDEGMHKPRHEAQAAYYLPPIINYHNGPAGMKYNPGTALGKKWQNRFFIAEFVGNPTRSAVHSFWLKPQGAGFELAGEEQVVSGILTVGIDFGPDGALYLADWIDGWTPLQRGRIWKIDVPKAEADPLRPKTQELIGASFDGKNEKELEDLLQYPDKRIRQKAQFELAKRGDKGKPSLLAAATQTSHQLARIHGLWGLGQLARKNPENAALLTTFLQDNDPEIIAQTLKLIGDLRFAAPAGQIIPFLQNETPRIRFFAAEALGRIGHKPAVQPLVEMLRANNDQDLYLRHAGSTALARLGEAEPLIALSKDPSKAVRTAAVVALRKMKHPGVAQFLADQEEYVAAEAARAINDDGSIEAALPDLAKALKNTRFTSEVFLRRAINANSRVGQPENITLLTDFIKNTGAPAEMRAEALLALSVWAKPSELDRVDGRYRGVVTRDATPAKTALEPLIEKMLNEKNPTLQIAAAQAGGKLKLAKASPTLFALIKVNKNSEVRIAALDALKQLADPNLDQAIEAALNDKDAAVRAAGLRILPESGIDPQRAVTLFSSMLEKGSDLEQQSALVALGKYKNEASAKLLDAMLEKLKTGKVKREIQLELQEAVEASASTDLKAKLEGYRGSLPADDVVAQYQECLSGGNPRRGQRIMAQHQGAQCMRCHAIWEWGSDVGPNLGKVGAKYSAEYILESLLEPSAKIALGYGVATLELKNGETTAGIVEAETAEEITLKLGKTEAQTYKKSDIQKREDSPSSMPGVKEVLTRREIRDLVAFLVTLKEEKPEM